MMQLTSLLMHTVGAKTGKARTTSLTYTRDGGGPRWPGRHHNLKANPDIGIDAGRKRFAVTTSIPEEDPAIIPDRQVDTIALIGCDCQEG